MNATTLRPATPFVPMALMRTIKLGVVAIIIALAIATGWWLWQQVRIDSCLDRGGRWDGASGCVRGE